MAKSNGNLTIKVTTASGTTVHTLGLVTQSKSNRQKPKTLFWLMHWGAGRRGLHRKEWTLIL